MTHPNRALIARFYEALARLDAAAMTACYHADATFSDPVFGALDHDGACAMWSMLCARAVDLTIATSDLEADADRGRAHVEARYTYSATGRAVVNRIEASFQFRDGLIARHDDRFDLYRWMRQALGPLGWLAGWLPVVQRRVRAQAARSLASYRARAGRQRSA